MPSMHWTTNFVVQSEHSEEYWPLGGCTLCRPRTKSEEQQTMPVAIVAIRLILLLLAAALKRRMVHTVWSYES